MITNEQKTAMDDLHLRKIDLPDRVLVVSPGGYIGESTSREIAYAQATGKPISFTDPDLSNTMMPPRASDTYMCVNVCT